MHIHASLCIPRPSKVSKQMNTPKNGYFSILQKKIQSIYGRVVAHLSMSDEEEYSQAFVVIEVLS